MLATDDVGIAKVEAYKDGILLTTLTSSPYKFTWDTTQEVNGSAHALEVKAYDAAGNAGTSGSIPITVVNVPPAVSIISPAHDATVSGMVTFVFSATSSVPDVRTNNSTVYVDGQFAWPTGNGVCTSNVALYCWSWSSALIPDGSHTVQATVSDLAGNVGASPLINITTQNGTKDTTAPSVPQNLVGTAPSQSEIDLTWKASADNLAVAGYKVYRNGAQV